MAIFTSVLGFLPVHLRSTENGLWFWMHQDIRVGDDELDRPFNLFGECMSFRKRLGAVHQDMHIHK